MVKEKQIVHENGDFWVLQEKAKVFTVMKAGITHSTSIQSFDDLSLATAYCDYKANRSK